MNVGVDVNGSTIAILRTEAGGADIVKVKGESMRDTNEAENEP